MNRIEHPTVEERRARGKAARDRVAPSGHAGWEPAAGRPDPVALLAEQNLTREPDLVPVRHGRMMVSPFTFYRGAAKIMAADLKDTPTAGLETQLCGDAHLSNFGGFASPERVLLFDLNDFDETLPGPFEYDVKRMAASFTIAARNNGHSESEATAASRASASAYREAMLEFAEMGTMAIWYAVGLRPGRPRRGQRRHRRREGGRPEEGQGRPQGRAQDRQQGAHPRQHASVVETGRTRRRPVPDHQRPTCDRPVAGHAGVRRLLGRRDRTHGPRAVPRVPGDPAGGPPAPVGAL